MSWRTVDHLVSGFGEYLQDDYMRHLGIANSRRIAKCYNHLRYAERRRLHNRAYSRSYEELLRENGPLDSEAEQRVIRDGWFLDRTKSLPHLDRLLEQAGKMIAERGGVKHAWVQQPFFRSLLFPGDIETFPALLDFILSSPVLKTVGNYMKTAPVLSKTRPPGVRVMESNAKFDPAPDGPLRGSQQFHLDLHDSPLVYILVLLKEVTPESGPWSFLPASVSAVAQDKLRYQRRGVSYRISDEAMYECVDKKDLIVFTGEPGDVLFIDSSACFHFGSRNSVIPRFLAMYGFTTPCRADMTLTSSPGIRWPRNGHESALRKLVIAPYD